MKKISLMLLVCIMGSLLHVDTTIGYPDSARLQSLQKLGSKCQTDKCHALHRVLQEVPRVQTDSAVQVFWDLVYIQTYVFSNPESRPSFDSFFLKVTGMKNNSQNRLKALHEKLDRHELTADDKKVFFHDVLCASDSGIELVDEEKFTQAYQKITDTISSIGGEFYEFSTEDPASQAGCLAMNYVTAFNEVLSQLQKEVEKK